jgi:hypothetical protein
MQLSLRQFLQNAKKKKQFSGYTKSVFIFHVEDGNQEEIESGRMDTGVGVGVRSTELEILALIKLHWHSIHKSIRTYFSLWGFLEFNNAFFSRLFQVAVIVLILNMHLLRIVNRGE